MKLQAWGKVLVIVLAILFSTINVLGATGGTITTNGLYTIHTFNTNGVFASNTTLLNVNILVIGGGGGGGGATGNVGAGGGGGGGGYQYNTSNIINGSYNVVIGIGGTAGGTGTRGSNGSNSSFNNIVAVGGGGGGNASQNGTNGGSGGGAGGSATVGGTGSQGNSGGGGSASGGGGGGSNTSGVIGVNANANSGWGGNGTINTINGTSIRWAAGGGGGCNGVCGIVTNGGLTGGGNGGRGSTTVASAGTANTGGGGGGGSQASNVVRASAAGGSGIVIIRYLTDPFNDTNVTFPYTNNAYTNNNNLTYSFITNNLNYSYTFYNVTSLTGGTNYTFNSSTTSYTFTNLGDDKYYYDLTLYDTLGNIKYFDPNITIDTIPPSIYFLPNTTINNSNNSLNYIYVNINATDININKTTIYLYNNNLLISNVSTNISGVFNYNFTSLVDGLYYFNATSTDLANNINSTTTYSTLIDTTPPILTFNNINNTFVRDNVTLNLSIVEVNPLITYLYLYNYSGTLLSVVNSTIITPSNLINNLTIYYSFNNDSLSGINPTDLSGHGFTGQNNGATIGVPGISSDAFYFTSNGSSYVNITNFGLLTVTQNFSISVWVKLNDTSDHNIVYNYKNLGEMAWVIDTESGYIKFCVWVASGSVYCAQSLGIPTNTWTHIVGVYDGDLGTGKLYINGVLKDNASMPITGTAAQTAGELGIGASPTGTGGIIGYIDEMGFWHHKALNLVDVTQLYANGLSSPYPFNNVSNVGILLLNYTFTNDGIYYYNATSIDIVGHTTITPTFTVISDTTPPSIYFLPNTTINNSNNSLNYIYVNINATDININKTTIYLYNNNLLISNVSTNISGVFNYNFTSLVDGLYYFNATSTDLANNINSTTTYSTTLDTIAPIIIFNNNTDTGYKNVSNIFVSISIFHNSSTNFTIYLYNGSGNLIDTNFNTTIANLSYSTFFVNNLSNGTYYYNATAYDSAGNYNSTSTNNITLISFQNNSYTNTFPYINNGYTNNPNLTYGFTTTDPYYNYTIYTLYSLNNTNITCYQETANTTPCNNPSIGNYNFVPYFMYINYSKPLNALNTSLWRINFGGNPIDQYISIPQSCWDASPMLQFRFFSTTDNSQSFGECYNGISWTTITNISSIGTGLTYTGTTYYTGGLTDGIWDSIPPHFGCCLVVLNLSTCIWTSDFLCVDPGFNLKYATLREEGMLWKLNTSTTNITTTEKSLSAMLNDGKYYYGLTIYDKVGNNQFYDPNITIDTTPPSIIFSNNTPINGTTINNTNIFTINISVNDTNLDTNRTEIDLYNNATQTYIGPGCYQESANTTNMTGIDGLTGYSCGLQYTGNYYVDPTGYYIYINYTKPTINLVGAKWLTQYGGRYITTTIPTSCLQSSILQLRIYSSAGNGDVPPAAGYCYNGSTWNSILPTDGSNTGGGFLVTGNNPKELWDGIWGEFVGGPYAYSWTFYEASVGQWISPGGAGSSQALSMWYEEAIFWQPRDMLNYTFTNMPDGTYLVNATAYDYANNTNSTETRQFTINYYKTNITVYAIDVGNNNIPYNITVNGTTNNYFYTNTGNTTIITAAGPINNITIDAGPKYNPCTYILNNLSDNDYLTCYFYQDRINVTVTEPYIGLSVSNYTLNYTTSGYTKSITANGTNVLIDTLNATYNFTFTQPHYITAHTVFTPQNVALNATQNYNTTMNQTVITLIMRNAADNAIINNQNMTIIDTNYGKIYNVTTGVLVINPLTGTHTFTINATRYGFQTTNLTFTDQEIQTINISLYPILNISLYDEKLSMTNLTYFNLSSPQILRYTIYCLDANGTATTAISDIIPNNTIQPFSITTTCYFKRIRFDLQYINLDGTITAYNRIVILPATINAFDFKVYLPDLRLGFPILDTILKPYDIYGVYTIAANTEVQVTKLMPTGTEQITSDYIDAEGKIEAYLIQGDQYILTIFADGVPARVLGPYIANTEGTKVLRLFDVSLATTANSTSTTVLTTAQIIPVLGEEDNHSILVAHYQDQGNYTQTLTMTVLNGTYDNTTSHPPCSITPGPGCTIMNQTIPYNMLNTSTYDVYMSLNVYGSKYMNKTSNQKYAVIIQRTYFDGTSDISIFTLIYDTFIRLPAQFSNPWTFPWIVILVLVGLALALNARTVNVGSLIIVMIAMVLYGWNWYATGNAAPGTAVGIPISIALLIAIFMNMKKSMNT